MTQRLLFVCSGNTCRSPLAEAIARKAIAALGLTDVEVSSAGTGAWEGATASDGSLLVGMERGLDLSAHRACVLSREIVAKADVILTMSQQHLMAVEALGGAGKAFLLTAYTGRTRDGADIVDPYGLDLEAYRVTATELESEVPRAVERFAAERSPGKS